jgi:hypothetical protein
VHSAAAAVRILVTQGAGSAIATAELMRTAQDVNSIVNKILADAGARPCVKCGRQSSIPARPGLSPAESQLWFCFECGHEETEGGTPVIQ